MGRRSALCWLGVVGLLLAGCEEEPPRLERIEIAAAHRACGEDDACGVVETSCTSRDCECGVAVNAEHLLEYQEQLAVCRGQEELATCDFECKTPFAKCFKGACVLTKEPPAMFRRGRDVKRLCESTRGTYVGCPKCPPNERCKSCDPCECVPSDRWTKKGCRRVLDTEARDIRVEVRPSVADPADRVKVRVHNEARQKIWLRTVCGSPLHRLRKKEDGWESAYAPFDDSKCRVGSLGIAAGQSKPFAIDDLKELRTASGEEATPGTYRFELTYTDGDDSFDHYATVYSAEFDVAPKRSRR